MEIRLLAAGDAAEFQALRLRALLDNPEAFGSTHAEEVDRALDVVAARLAPSPETGFVLGAALAPGAPLVGLAGCYRESARKQRHKGVVWGMYVAPEARGGGVGGALLDAVVARARSWPGVEQLTLTVVPENDVARALYVARGFRPFGREPRALYHGGRYYDLEYFWLPLSAG